MDQAGTTKDATTADIAALAPATDLTYTAATRTLASSTGADVVLPVATTTDAGLESAADKTKLDSITVDSATVVRKLVRNNTGASIAKGQAVYQTGSSGVTITVALADASIEATASQTLGLTQDAIANNATGYVIAVGELTGLNTSALTEGQMLWLSETAGGLTTTRPTQPAHGVVMGYCVKQGSGTSGILYVKVDNGLELNELHDVLISSPTNGQVLRRASDGLWKNAVLAYSDLSGLPTLPTGTNTGDQTIANTSDATSHTVALSASGGSVQLVEGSNITLTTSGTSGAGVVTIASTGGSPGGSTTQVQFNSAGSFGGDADLIWNSTTNVLGVTGDVNLSDGGTYTTTLQTITPTAARTISFPDATGTVGLVGGSSGNLVVNQSGAYAGVANSSVDNATGNITLGSRFISTVASASSAPAAYISGTWFAGTSSNALPALYVSPAGTSVGTSWATAGTGFGVNAPAAFGGNLLDLQVNGTRAFSVDKDGVVISRDTISSGGNIRVNADANQLIFGASQDIRLIRDAAGTLAQRNGTTAQTSRVYNTFTSSTNYELGKLEWSSNVFRIGTEKGSGGGTARAVEVHTDSIARLACDTTGSVRVVTALTVATLPGTPAVGMVARVTDALAPAVGTTVAGGGAAAALVWYNGANWSVIGV